MVELPEFKVEKVNIHVIGITPLIVHNWNKKAIDQMLGKHLGEASKGREKKVPLEDFAATLYPINPHETTNGIPRKFGCPAPAFKACAVSGANAVSLKMTQVKQAFHVSWYTVPIIAKPLTSPVTEWDAKYAKELKPYHALGISMRMDVTRNDNGNPDLRFRAWFPEWEAELEVTYNPHALSLAQLLGLFRSGGFGCGIGEWRPSSPICRSGEFGRFEVR